MPHVHENHHTSTQPFSGAVSHVENRSAHGNVCYVETCACGAQRRTNVNGRHTERGDWTPTYQFVGRAGSGYGYHVSYHPETLVLGVAVHVVETEDGWVRDATRTDVPAHLLPAGALDLLTADGFSL